MKTNPVRRLRPVVFIALVIMITALMAGFAGCNTLVLSEEPDEVKLLQKVFPEAVYYQYDEEAKIYTAYGAGKNRLGYAFTGNGEGYNGEIIILIGLEDKETIEAISVISHKEQQCVGEYAVKLELGYFITEFTGLKIDDCELEKYEGQVDRVTGATTSSKAIVDIVRETALEKAEYIN